MRLSGFFGASAGLHRGWWCLRAAGSAAAVSSAAHQGAIFEGLAALSLIDKSVKEEIATWLAAAARIS